MSEVIVFEEKYGSRYLDASTPELKAKSFLMILRERLNDGYTYYRPELGKLTQDEQDLIALTPEAISSLPTSVRDGLTKDRERLVARRERQEIEFRQENQWFERADKLVALPVEEAIAVGTPLRNGGFRSLAETLLNDRNGYEYEGFEVEKMESPES